MIFATAKLFSISYVIEKSDWRIGSEGTVVFNKKPQVGMLYWPHLGTEKTTCSLPELGFYNKVASIRYHLTMKRNPFGNEDNAKKERLSIALYKMLCRFILLV